MWQPNNLTPNTLVYKKRPKRHIIETFGKIKKRNSGFLWTKKRISQCTRKQGTLGSLTNFLVTLNETFIRKGVSALVIVEGIGNHRIETLIGETISIK